MHTVYCIIGRTASGKSTITRLAANKLGMTILKSYTTRNKRKGEEINSDHIFISEKEKDLSDISEIRVTQIQIAHWLQQNEVLFTTNLVVKCIRNFL